MKAHLHETYSKHLLLLRVPWCDDSTVLGDSTTLELWVPWRYFPFTFPLVSHRNTHQTQFPGSLPDFPFHLVQFQTQLLTGDHPRPFWRWWWWLWLGCQGVHLPLQHQPVTNSLVHEAKHIHNSTHFTPCTEWPGPISDHSHKQLIYHSGSCNKMVQL